MTPKTPKKNSQNKNLEWLYNSYSLHHARLMDLVQLCEVRQWDMHGYRETTLFLYRYWSSCFLSDPKQVLDDTLELNQQFTMPLGENEVIKATRSAEKAYHARSDKEANRIAQEKGYPGAGYNVSNAKLIKWLDITGEEQRHMGTIIGRDEKQRRDTEATRAARRAAGMVPREGYLAQADKRRQEAIKLRGEGMTQRAIAEQLGINQSQVSRIIKNSNLRLCMSVPLY